MPLLVQVCGGETRPVVACDHCRQPVEAADGVVLWQEPEPRCEAVPAFAHADCLAAFEQTRPGFWLTSDLDTALVLLAKSVRMDATARRRAEGKARILSML